MAVGRAGAPRACSNPTSSEDPMRRRHHHYCGSVLNHKDVVRVSYSTPCWHSVRLTLDAGLGVCATNFVPVVCVRFQPCTSAWTNPTPDLTLTLTLTSPLSEGSKSAGAGAGARLRRVLRWRFKITRAAERSVSTNDRQEVCCIPVLHFGRVCWYVLVYIKSSLLRGVRNV